MMYQRWLHPIRRLLSAALAVLLLLPAPALASSAPLTGGGAQNGMVRVRLSSLGNPSTLTLKIHGSYTVNGQSSRSLADGASVTVQRQNGGLTLVVNGQSTPMGTAFKLRRHAANGQSGVQIAQGRVPGNLYPGDFTFTLQNGTLYIVASIYMEDYLYGVLPYEMGNQSGLEALKAQAVAARTYTLRAMSVQSGRLYDVVDTTADQVYNGTPSGNANCKRAVDETKGIVVKNGSSFTATYYTASNGGQTETPQNAWGTGGAPALTVKDDPYDLRNSAAAKRSFTISFSGAQGNAKFDALLRQKAAAVFGAGASVTQVSNVSVHTPRYASPSKLYTKLSLSVSYVRDGKTHAGSLTFDIFGELEGPLSMSINSMKNELWTVEKTAAGFTVSARRYGHGIGMSQRGAMQMAKEGLGYAEILGFYYTGCQRVQYTLTRSILSPVVSGQKSQEQVTAEQPAPIADVPASAGVPAAETAATEASPAPQSDPLPQTPEQPGAKTAYVATPKGSLNLRKHAKDTAKVLRTVPQGAKVQVEKQGKNWCKITYEGVTGYAMSKFLSSSVPAAANSASAPAVSASAPAAAPAVSSSAPAGSSGLTARVATKSGSLYLRKTMNGSSKILASIPQNTVLSLLSRGSKWCKATYEGKTGYVMTKYLSFTAESAGQGAAPKQQSKASSGKQTAKTALKTLQTAVLGQVLSPNGNKLNLRAECKSSARVLLKLLPDEYVTITAVGDTWCAVTYQGVTGYCMREYLDFTLYETL